MQLDRLKLERCVDRLLAPFAGPGPGATIGVVQDGALTVHRHAGMASIELAQPIHAGTRFRIASVSKQFTCAAVLKLAGEGRLSVEDDIRTYLPELPELDFISIDMLMRNMAGIRDMLEIQRLGGMDLSIPCQPSDLLAGICRQRDTNFPPGERFLYSNSNFLLAGLIVERVTGQSLPDYLHRHFFAPLGMNATRMTPTVSEIVPDLATGYLPKPGGGFFRAAHAFPLGGEGGLVSCVLDLALWDQALASGAVDHEGLTQQAHFTNGTLNSYARGLIVGRFRGVRTEDHGGLWPGYKTAFLRAPEHNATVICIANNGGADPAQLALSTLSVVLDGKPGVLPARALPPRPKLAPLAGRYLDAATPMTLELAVNEEGAMICTAHGTPMTVSAGEDGRLVAGRGALALRLRPGAETLEVELGSGHIQHFTRLEEPAALPPGLDGRYANPDMGAIWTIAGDSVAVVGPLVSAQRWTVSGMDGDVIRINMPSVLFKGWADARVLRNAAGDITGLFVNGGRAKRVVFTRQPSNP